MAALYGFSAATAGGGGGVVAGLAPGKGKRKDLDEVRDEFAEFSLFSPARKIRRLVAEGTPLMENDQEELAIPHGFGQPLLQEQLHGSSQEMAAGSLNEERAIVLYKPVHTSFIDSSPSSDVFLKVDPDVMAGFKNRGFWSGQTSIVEIREVEEEEEAPIDEGQAASGGCLAVVPWMPSQPTVGAAFPAGAREVAEEEEMVAGDMGDAPMDVEEEAGQPAVAAAVSGDGMAVTQAGFQHWQQHCMMPQIGPSNCTPIPWSWG